MDFEEWKAERAQKAKNVKKVKANKRHKNQRALALVSLFVFILALSMHSLIYAIGLIAYGIMCAVPGILFVFFIGSFFDRH